MPTPNVAPLRSPSSSPRQTNRMNRFWREFDAAIAGIRMSLWLTALAVLIVYAR
jgi:hypothetical protein